MLYIEKKCQIILYIYNLSSKVHILKYQCPAMSESQYRLIRVTVQLKKLELNVKFPCTISFQLKNQSNYIETRHNYQLKDGSCMPNDKLSIDVEMLYDGDRYHDKNISLIVFMTSANGKIPAGSAFISVSELGILAQKGESTVPLNKCPDKSAQLTYLKKNQLVRTIRRAENQNRNQKVKALLIKSRNLRNNPKTSRKSKSPSNHHSNFDRDEKFGNKYSKNLKKNQLYSARDHFTMENGDKMEHSAISGLESQYLYEEGLSYQNQDKIFELQKQRTNYMKEISKLKGELNVLKRNQIRDSEQQIAKYASEVDKLVEELEKLKEKSKNSQRKEKQILFSNRDLRQQGERLKNKISQHQLIQMQNELLLEEKQKLIKALTQELKQKKEDFDDLKLSKAAHEKKNQFKEQSFKQQMNKMNEKYQQSEIERQKNLLQLNNKLTQMEQLEKKHQLTSKEKQRAFLEEKNTLLKKMENLNKNIEELNEQKLFLIAQNNDYQGQVCNLTKKHEEKIEQLSNNKSEKQSLEVEVQKYKNILHKYQKQLQQGKVVLDERNKLKKNFNDKSVEYEKHKQISDKNTKKIKDFEKKIKSLELQLVQSNKQKAQINGKALSLTKEVDMHKKIIENKDRQIDTLTSMIQNSTIKYNEIKNRSENQFMRSEETIKRLEEDLTYLIRTKDHLQSQYEDSKWRLAKCKETNDALQEKIQNSNNQILKFNQENLSLQEKNKKMFDEVKEMESKINLLKNEKETIEQKQKELGELLKQKNDTIYESTKAVQKKEQQIFITTEKQKQKEVFYEEKSKRDEEVIKNKNEQIKQLKDKLNQLNIILVQKDEKVHLFELDLSQKNQEIAYHKEIGDKHREGEINQQKIKNDYYQELQQIQKLLSQALSSNGQFKEQIKKKQIQLFNYKSEFEKFKLQNRSAFEQFINELGKEEISQTPKSQLQAFPDMQMSNMQIQAFKKRNLITMKNKDLLREIEENKNVIECELEKCKKYQRQQEEQYEQNMSDLKNKNKQLHKELLEEKQKLNQEIRSLQEKHSDFRHQHEILNNQFKNTNNYVQELQKQIQRIMNENTNYQNEINLLNKKNTELKIARSQSVTSKENEYNSLIGERRNEVEKYKILSTNFERKLINSEKAVSQKDEIIQKLEKNISTLRQEKMKIQQANQFQKKKIDDLNLQITKSENNLKNLERKLKQKIKNGEQLASQLQEQKFKHEETRLKLKKENQITNQLSDKVNALARDIEKKNQASLQIESQIKKTEKGHKQLIQKAHEQAIGLKEKEIMLTSELELKDFLVQQQQANINLMKNQINELQSELSEKKSELSKQSEKLSEVENEMMFIQQNHTVVNDEKQILEKQYGKVKNKLQQASKQLLDYHILLDNLANKEKQVTKLKEDLEQNDSQSNLLIKDLRKVVSELRKQISQKNVREEELKRKVRELEKMVQKKSYQMLSTKKKYKNEAEREKIQILHDLEELERENIFLQKQFEQQQDHFSREIENLTSENMTLNEELASKSQILKSKDRQLREYEQKIKKMTKTYIQSQVQNEASRVSTSNQFGKIPEKYYQNFDSSHLQKEWSK